MIVECPKCKAKYKVSDEKLASKHGPVRMKCKKCGAVITVEPPSTDREWYVAAEGERKGPFKDAELIGMAKKGEIEASTFIWTKGFDNWKKAEEVDLLFDAFGTQEEEDENEETQMLDAKAIQRLTGEFSAAASELESGDNGKDTSDDGLVWQRHESSVLFSLDDYSPGMRTLTKGQAVVDLGEEEVADTGNKSEDIPDVPEVGVISLDEQDVINVKKTLDAGQKRQRTMYIVIGAVAAIAIVVVAVLFMGGKTETHKNVEKKAAPIVKKTTEPKKKIVLKKKVVAPVKKPEKTVATTTEKAKPANENKAVEAKTNTKTEDNKAKVVKKPSTKVAKKTRRNKKNKSTAKRKKKAPAKVAVARKPKPAPADGGAQSILASLRAGKKRQQQKNNSASNNNANLPRVLPPSVIMRVMRGAKPKIKNCLITAGVENNGQLVISSHLTISGNGKVQSIRLSGKVGGARSCITRVLRSLHFPRFKEASMPVNYPYVF